MVPGKDRVHVGPDLIEDGIPGDPVGPDNNGIDFTGPHEMGGHGICDNRDRDAIPRQFPCREACSLQERPGLACDHVYLFACLYRGTDDAKCGPPRRTGKGPGIAVGKDRTGVWQQRCAMFPYGMTTHGVLTINLLCHSERPLLCTGHIRCLLHCVQYAVYAPAEIDCSRTGGPEHLCIACDGDEKQFQRLFPAP